ncbi:MAG: hypothetical protein OEZ21_08640 [Candidatus Bathyarchaeota archaeon]|nr:hypothetical protein [Candidatus Bathyarchaeota archaeon]MDH5747005.1 hypothetical protein [Candidatus Bathyarchaeota archaeon]
MKGLGKGITLFLLGLILIYSAYAYSGKPFTELLTTDVEQIGSTLQATFLIGVALFIGGPLYALVKTLTDTTPKEEKILPIFGISPARKKQYASTSRKGKYDADTHAITEKHAHVKFAKNILDEKKMQKMKPFYVKVKGIKFKVQGDKKDYTHWQVACEHLRFEELCIDCAINALKEFNWDNIEIQK